MFHAPASRRILAAVVILVAAALLLLMPSCATTQNDAASNRIYRIAVISPGTATPVLDAMRQRLAQLGYAEGINLVIEPYYAEGRIDRLPGLAAKAAAGKPDVIFSGATISTLAAKQATTTVPIVFAGLFDPLATGVVADLARPGGNVTGASMDVADVDLYGRWVELLAEARPGLGHIAVLSNPGPLTEGQLRQVHAAARNANVKVDVVTAGDTAALDAALAAIGKSGAQGMIVMPDPFFTPNREKLASFAASQRIPSMYFFKVFADAGGMMSYGASQEDAYRRGAEYIVRIFQGARPGDIPVYRPTRAELVINTKTAKGMGIMIPEPLLKRANRLID